MQVGNLTHLFCQELDEGQEYLKTKFEFNTWTLKKEKKLFILLICFLSVWLRDTDVLFWFLPSSGSGDAGTIWYILSTSVLVLNSTLETNLTPYSGFFSPVLIELHFTCTSGWDSFLPSLASVHKQKRSCSSGLWSTTAYILYDFRGL